MGCYCSGKGPYVTVCITKKDCVYLILALVQSLHRAQPSSTDSSMVLTIMKRDVQ